jgi:type II secretory pathway pseudopilin PulG
MDTSTGASTTHGGGYEFTPDQNRVIRSTGVRVLIWGVASLIGGGLTALAAVAVFVAGEAAGVVVGIVWGVLALIPIFIGLNFVRAGRALGAVVGTAGSDIDHLMGAIKNLGAAFLIQIVATASWVVIFGILMALAIPSFGDTRERAYLAAMRSDLRNLASQEEIFYADNFRYTADLTAIRFVASDGVTIVISGATEMGWAATTTHAALPESGCAIYFGDVTPPTTVGGSTPGEPGSVMCD